MLHSVCQQPKNLQGRYSQARCGSRLHGHVHNGWRVAAPLPLQETAQGILEGRLAMGALRGGVLSIGCGFIMTTAVTFARQDKMLPLIFGVPLFIVCGFPHCVADGFYYLCVPLAYIADHWQEVLLFYVSIVAGNFIGCNLYRFLSPSHPSC